MAETARALSRPAAPALSDAEVADLERLDAEATPGPWAWRGNTGCFSLYLCALDGMRTFILKFQRWGMRDAQPVLADHAQGVIRPATDFVQYEVPYRKDIIGIDHPDARFIAAARAAIPRLLATLRAWRRGVEDANRLTQEHQARADRMEEQHERLRAVIHEREHQRDEAHELLGELLEAHRALVRESEVTPTPEEIEAFLAGDGTASDQLDDAEARAAELLARTEVARG